MYFRLKPKVGGHAEKDPATKKCINYKAGDIIESATELDVLFSDKFERVDDDILKLRSKTRSKKVSGVDKPRGRNVTKRFKGAAEQDFLVFADGSDFYVYEADEPGVALHDGPLTKKEVLPFVEKYLAD